MVEKSVLDVLGSMFQIIILLKNEIMTKRIQCIQMHGVLKDVFMLKLIHYFLILPQSTHSQLRDTSPNHNISTPMLHCWNLVLGVETSTQETTNPLYPICTKQHAFAFITPKDIFSLLDLILVPLSLFCMCLAILHRDHRFSIHCSCLKSMPDSTSRRPLVSQSSCTFSAASRGDQHMKDV